MDHHPGNGIPNNRGTGMHTTSKCNPMERVEDRTSDELETPGGYSKGVEGGRTPTIQRHSTMSPGCSADQGGPGTNSVAINQTVIPQGMTIFGRWKTVALDQGSAFLYLGG